MSDKQTTDVLLDLCEENPDIPWTGEGGLFERAATDIAALRSMLSRAMQHGVNGSDHYHAIRASELGDEIKAYLKENPI